MGQKYCFEQPIEDGSGRRVWGHARLLMPRSEDADIYLRAIFRAVPLSRLVQAEAAAKEPLPEPPSPPANVVTMRSRRSRVLVVEDDLPYLKAA